MPYYEEFGDLLDQHIIDLDRSESWIANRLDVSNTTVNRWRRGESRPVSPEMTIRLADVLRIPSEERLHLLKTVGYAVVSTTETGSESTSEEERMMSAEQTIDTQSHQETNPHEEGQSTPDNRGGGNHVTGTGFKIEGGLNSGETITHNYTWTNGQSNTSDLDVIVAALEKGAKNREFAMSETFVTMFELINDKFADHVGMQYVLQQHQKSPEPWSDSLRQVLLEAQIDKIPQIVDAAKKAGDGR
ncbi:MAG: helix-turn-helix transcriptional regulator [Chloroflexota bacterium]